MPAEDCFVEVDYFQQAKRGHAAAGDVFASQRIGAEDRTISILADGLGSGIKARVLATMTATMAMKYASNDIDIRRASEIIISTLPVCSQRKIGYSTFTIVDTRGDGHVRLIEYDNPGVVLVRGLRIVELDKRAMPIRTGQLGERELYYSEFEAMPGDRIVVFSDGVTQAGMGKPVTPLGWTRRNAVEYVLELVRTRPELSARQLARALVHQAVLLDDRQAKDDISCAVIYLRRPRRLLVMTGPPIDKARDVDMGVMVRDYPGRKVICGGTTAGIVARELGATIKMDLQEIDPIVPPRSTMEGVDFVTEGTITLSRLAELLEHEADPDDLKPNAAVRLLGMMLESDIIEFVVGTKVNDAHQDPNLPVELDIRRNLIKRLVRLLNETYLKDAHLQFI